MSASPGAQNLRPYPAAPARQTTPTLTHPHPAPKLTPTDHPRRKPMPARSGAQYLAGLRDRKTEVWLRGERVSDVTTHPGLASGARAIASLYDLQSDPAHRDVMTFADPTTGDR